jgi:hypothetical protein
MKNTPLVLSIAAALLVCVWLLRKPEQLPSTEAALPTSPGADSRQQAATVPGMTVNSSSKETKPDADTPSSSYQAWIDVRTASRVISQALDPATDEPVGTIKIGSSIGTLGETPPFYRFKLKTTKHPILLGDKDDRHRFIRRVTSVHQDEKGVFLKPEIAVVYPRTLGLGGFVFRKDEGQITQLGVIIPDIKVPESGDPTSLGWSTQIRIADREITADELATAMPQQLSPDTVLVMPTHHGPSPETARVLWLALDANGSFAVARK